MTNWVKAEGLAGNLSSDQLSERIVVGQFSAHMQAVLKCPDLELVTSVAVLDKMMFDHGIGATQLAQLNQIISKPQRIYQSASHAESVVVVSVELLQQKPILVPIWINKAGPKGKPAMHWVSSAYTKDDPNVLTKWERDGLRLWP